MPMMIYSSDYAELSYSLHGDCAIFTIKLNRGQNQFSPSSVLSINEALTVVEKKAVDLAKQNDSIQRAALVTVGAGKYYSTGLMLQDSEVQSDLPKFLSKHYLQLMGRLLVFPLVTVAAINGHAFAGGMVMAMANDFRVMRADRGFLCMNEIELPSPVPAGMAAVVRAKTSSPSALRDCFLSAKRFSAQEALNLRLLDKISSEEKCLEDAVKLAIKSARLISLMPIVQSIKRDLYPDAIELLENPGSMKHVPELIMKSKL